MPHFPSRNHPTLANFVGTNKSTVAGYRARERYEKHQRQHRRPQGNWAPRAFVMPLHPSRSRRCPLLLPVQVQCGRRRVHTTRRHPRSLVSLFLYFPRIFFLFFYFYFFISFFLSVTLFILRAPATGLARGFHFQEYSLAEGTSETTRPPGEPRLPRRNLRPGDADKRTIGLPTAAGTTRPLRLRTATEDRHVNRPERAVIR